MPAAVLVRESCFLRWLGGGCIFSSRAMHLPPDVCGCCGSWILTVGVWLGMARFGMFATSRHKKKGNMASKQSANAFTRENL